MRLLASFALLASAAWGQGNVSGNVAPMPPSTLAVTALSSAATAVTATLPSVSGQFHYLTAIQIVRTCTAAVTGSALLAITTTNLPGSLAWRKAAKFKLGRH